MLKRIVTLFLALALFVAQSGAGSTACVTEKSACCTDCCSGTTDTDASNDDLPPCCQLTDCADDSNVALATTNITLSAKLKLFVTSVSVLSSRSSEPRRLAQLNLSLGNTIAPPLYITFASLLI